MPDPFRDVLMKCPACPAAKLRAFHGRMCCDECEGMQIAVTELSRAIVDLTGIDPTYEFIDEVAGKRSCPQCPTLMTTCKVRVIVEEELAKPAPELDRCTEHGVWFDREELAAVLAKVRAKVSPRGGRAAGWGGDRGGFGWWRTGM
jgi:Zn-finger nucleic acid-binding protein